MPIKKLFCLLFFTAAVGTIAVADETATDEADKKIILQMDFFYGDTKIADTTDTITFGDGTYHISSRAAAVGVAKLLYGDVLRDSYGITDDAQGLVMTLYTETRGFKTPTRAEKNHNNNTVTLSKGDETKTVTATVAVYDYLSALYRSHILGKPATGKFDYTDGWKFRHYVYENAGTETITTPLGNIDAVVLRRPSPRGERKIWLSPAHHHLPVKMHLTDKGHEFTLLITHITQN